MLREIKILYTNSIIENISYDYILNSCFHLIGHFNVKIDDAPHNRFQMLS